MHGWAQRDFDQVLLDLALTNPQSIQRRNSIASSRKAVRMIGFDRAHATVAVLRQTSSASDFAPLLATKEPLLLVGGQAVNLWELY